MDYLVYYRGQYYDNDIHGHILFYNIDLMKFYIKTPKTGSFNGMFFLRC